jgi:hypothetical protein
LHMEALNTGSPLWPGRFSKASGQSFGVTGKDGVAMSLELLYDDSRKVKTVPEPRRLVEKTLEVSFVVAGSPEVEPQAPHLQRGRDSAGDERIKTDDLDTGNWSSLNNLQPSTRQNSASPLLQAVLISAFQEVRLSFRIEGRHSNAAPLKFFVKRRHPTPRGGVSQPGIERSPS